MEAERGTDSTEAGRQERVKKKEKEKRENFAKIFPPFLNSSHGKNRTFRQYPPRVQRYGKVSRDVYSSVFSAK